MNMKTNYTIKNFRVFDKDGATIQLKPISLLTGCNSSGKSSIVKSLLLLCDYFSALKADKANGKKMDLNVHRLDFTKSPHSSMGKFSKVVNNKSEEQTIGMEISVHSLMLCQNVNVLLTFSSDEKDGCTNGYILSIKVSKEDGRVIYHSDKNKDSECVYDLSCIFEEFVRFTYTQQLFSVYEYICLSRNCGLNDNVMPDDEFKAFNENLKSYITEFKSMHGIDALKDIVRWNKNLSSGSSFFRQDLPDTPKMIEQIKETGILYYLPILTKRLAGSKDESLGLLSECINGAVFCDAIKETMKDAMKSVLVKIAEDFKASRFGNFIDYYRSKENEYLRTFSHRHFFPSSGKSPKLFSAQHVGINANHITNAPHHSVSLIGKNNGVQNDKLMQEIAEWENAPLSFELIYEAMAILSDYFCPQESMYHHSPDRYVYSGYSSKTEHLFFKYVEECIEEIFTDAAPEALMYVSSAIINVKRLYPLESTDEFTQLLKRYLDARRNFESGSEYYPDSFMNKWIKEFRIGDHVSIKVDAEGLGVTLRLHKSESDIEGTLLADNGYGITQIFAILLNIEVAIMGRKVEKVRPDDSLNPFIGEEDNVQTVTAATIAIEEPEIHLHPSFQSKLADLFYDAYKKYGIQFLIETHSEYLIRKSQLIVAGMGFENNNDSVSGCPFITYYVPEDSLPYSLGYRKDGKFMESFGTGFYDESANLAFDLL